MNSPRPPPRRVKRLILVAIVVVALVGASVIAYIVLEPKSVNITGVQYQFTGSDAPNCGWSVMNGTGATALSNQKVTVAIALTTPASSGPCQIEGVGSLTGGFAITNFTATARMGGGVGGTLTVTLSPPANGFTGVLTLEVIVKLPGGGSP